MIQYLKQENDVKKEKTNKEAGVLSKENKIVLFSGLKNDDRSLSS